MDLLVEFRPPEVTYCGVIGRDIEQDFRRAAAGHISVAVPHACYQVGLMERMKKAHIRSLNCLPSISNVV